MVVGLSTALSRLAYCPLGLLVHECVMVSILHAEVQRDGGRKMAASNELKSLSESGAPSSALGVMRLCNPTVAKRRLVWFGAVQHQGVPKRRLLWQPWAR